MDLSGKSTITNEISQMIDDVKIKHRTLSDQTALYEFAVAQSKLGNLSQDVISKLYCLAVNEDLKNYNISNSGIIIQDSYFALRSYALARQNNNTELSQELYKLLKLFPKPELCFYLTATTEERIKRNMQRDKPMAYMEKLLMSNPEKFEGIEKYLREGAVEFFNAEIIDTCAATHKEIASYISKKINARKIQKEVDSGKVY